MYNPKSVPENETHKILLDFEIQTDHLISAWRPDIVLENWNKYQELAMEHESDGDTDCN